MYGGSGNTSLLDSLFAYYSLNEAAGDAIDLVGSNDLSLSGTVTQNQAGKVGTAYTFATDGEMDGTTTDFQFTGTFSISFWMLTIRDTDWDGLICNMSAANYGWEIIATGTGVRIIRFMMRYDGGDVSVLGSTDINDGAWYHVVSSYSAVDDTMKVWINGVLEDSDENTNGIWYDASSLLDVGHRIGGANYTGSLDEIGIWRGLELSQGKVASLWNSGNGLAYPFD